MIFPKLTVPVVLEGPSADQKLISAIHGQLNALMDDDIHQDVAVAMLKSMAGRSSSLTAYQR